jgi:plasmid replication initiation protein
VAFSWIDSSRFRYTRSEDGKRVADTVVVAINEWLYSLAVQQRAMLTYHDDYFDLKPLARRLYEIARAHCGAQPYVRFNLEKLRLRVGSTMSTSDFKSRLMALSNAALLILKHYCVEGPSSEIRILASSMQGNFVRGLFTAI